MTIIAYRDGIMAADGGSFANDVLLSVNQKIIRTACGGLFAGTGKHVDCHVVGEWARGGFVGAAPEIHCTEDGGFGALFVDRDGNVFKLQTHRLIKTPVFAPFHADGFCFEMAMGAMAAGATAERAVQICYEIGQAVGGPIQVEAL